MLKSLSINGLSSREAATPGSRKLGLSRQQCMINSNVAHLAYLQYKDFSGSLCNRSF
jgi:hypothetical protein